MIRKRKDLEETENRILAGYAVRSSDVYAASRNDSEPEDDYRTSFQRDADRIFHTKAFRRLKDKTQVVLAGSGDHFRTRLIHTMNVANVATDIARRLGLNEDLCRAIAYGHDLGHTCFGHEGESVLDEKLRNFGAHFEHNEQSLWVVEKLEKLNLTQAVRDGLDKHRTVYDNPRSRDSKMPSLEAQAVNRADEIAYRFHDLDDGLRAEVFSVSDLDELKIWDIAGKAVSDNKTERICSGVMAFMIDDLIRNTDSLIEKAGVRHPDNVYAYPGSLVGFSDDMRDMVRGLGDFLFNRFYKSDKVVKYNEEGRKIITFLFDKFYNEPELMPEEFRKRLQPEEKHIVVKDYVAGMTDGYAINLYNKFSNV